MKLLIIFLSLLSFSFEGCSSSLNSESTRIPKIRFFLAAEGSNVNYLPESDTLNIVLPKLLQSVKPHYPNIAMRAGVNGSVIMRAWIDT